MTQLNANKANKANVNSYPPSLKDVLLRLFACFLSMLLLVALLFMSLSVLLHNSAFFEREYAALRLSESMGISTKELVAALMRVIDYMDGKAEDIRITVSVNNEETLMFNEREEAHMVDVRNLYMGFKITSWVILGLYAALVYVLYKTPKVLSKAFLHASAISLLLGLLALFWVVLDFSSFWVAFHKLFFTNDLWQLDPTSSRMIVMMPLEFFYNIISRLALIFGAVWLILCLSAGFVLRPKRGSA